jgi:hypothetical protein
MDGNNIFTKTIDGFGTIHLNAESIDSNMVTFTWENNSGKEVCLYVWEVMGLQIPPQIPWKDSLFGYMKLVNPDNQFSNDKICNSKNDQNYPFTQVLQLQFFEVNKKVGTDHDALTKSKIIQSEFIELYRRPGKMFFEEVVKFQDEANPEIVELKRSIVDVTDDLQRT